MWDTVCLILIALTVPCSCQLNYQKRAIYYSEKDNVCKYGDQNDLINLVINLDDAEVLKVTLRPSSTIATVSITKLNSMKKQGTFDCRELS